MNSFSSSERAQSRKWWEETSGVVRFCFPKTRGRTIRDISNRLDQVIDWGFGCIDIFAPYLGHGEYGGLDVLDYYKVDSILGTLDEYRDLVETAHQKGLAVISSVNFGYGAMDFPVFQKACADLRAGIDSPETHWFLWSDTGKETLDKSLAPHFLNDSDGHWHFSEQAGKYYWVKWRGFHNSVAMPQFHYGDSIFQEEMKKVVRFWMDTGIDGFIIDAVNWYINCNWQINYETLTGVIREYGEKFIQPEGGGGFQDDPVAWITKGKYNCVQDYGMSILWTDHYVIGNAILAGDPTPVETTLNTYRDRVVATGGVTHLGPRWGTFYTKDKSTLSIDQKLLEVACIVTIGELFDGDEMLFELDWTAEKIGELKHLLRAQRDHSALHAAGARIRLMTNDNTKFYAFLRTSKDLDQQALVVLNFQSEAREIIVQLEGAPVLERIIAKEPEPAITRTDDGVRLLLPGYGYALYRVDRPIG